MAGVVRKAQAGIGGGSPIVFVFVRSAGFSPYLLANREYGLSPHYVEARATGECRALRRLQPSGRADVFARLLRGESPRSSRACSAKASSRLTTSGCSDATSVVSPTSFSRSNSSWPISCSVVLARLAAVAGGVGVGVGVVEVELPIAAPHRLQLAAPVVEVRLVRRPGAGLRREQRPDVLAVDHPVGRRLGAGELGERRQHVDRPRHLVARLPGGDFARPAGQARLADAAVERRRLPLPQRPGRAGVVAVAAARGRCRS